jgi:hypothetical protein
MARDPATIKRPFSLIDNERRGFSRNTQQQLSLPFQVYIASNSTFPLACSSVAPTAIWLIWCRLLCPPKNRTNSNGIRAAVRRTGILPPLPIIAVLPVVAVGLSASRWALQPRDGTRDLAPPASFALQDVAALMPGIVTLVLLAAALWVILSRRYSTTDRHWAYGAIGLIAGFWLHA